MTPPFTGRVRAARRRRPVTPAHLTVWPSVEQSVRVRMRARRIAGPTLSGAKLAGQSASLSFANAGAARHTATTTILGPNYPANSNGTLNAC